MRGHPIDVAASGAVKLGDQVVCDGFNRNYEVRAQTHVHSDHLAGFETSKGMQDIYMLRATRKLLEIDHPSDVPIRKNIFSLESAEPVALDGCRLSLVRNGHMLGSAQVLVELDSGLRLGYSGDFQWPIDDPIQVDYLVVDSTYGSPASIREYDQADVERCLVGLLHDRLAVGNVHLKAFRGTAQRALQVLSANIDYPVLASARFIREAQVFRDHGYVICDLVDLTSDEADAIRRDMRFIQVYSNGDGDPVDVGNDSTIVLSAYMSNPRDPLMTYSERAHRVAMSNHADFTGTLEYVVATGARVVVTDNVRGNHGVDLALQLCQRLGIEAMPSSNITTREWGE